METNQTNNPIVSQKSTAKDFVLNLGAIVALYTIVFNLINLLFTVINKAYPQIVNGYNYSSSYSISFPVATLIIFFPIFILLMWLLEKGFVTAPEKKNLGVRKWLTYITLFIAGLTLAGDLVTVLYYFIDGQELTVGFLLKICVVLFLTGLVFYYYISDIREKLTPKSRLVWLLVSSFIILASIVWGFFVLGSPRTQQLLKYDEQKVSDLQAINSDIQDYYQVKLGDLPAVLANLDGAPLNGSPMYAPLPVDPQTKEEYEYKNTNMTTYQLCATFNKASTDMENSPYVYGGQTNWNHPAGHYCFTETVMPIQSPKTVPVDQSLSY